MYLFSRILVHRLFSHLLYSLTWTMQESKSLKFLNSLCSIVHCKIIKGIMVWTTVERIWTVGKCPLGCLFMWKRRWNHCFTAHAEVISGCDIRETTFTYGRSLRSNFSNEKIELLCHERAATTALTVFRVNILWKLRNTHLRGSTVGFCDIFSCLISELVSEFLFAEADQKRILLQQEMNNASYGVHSFQRGFPVCVYIYLSDE